MEGIDAHDRDERRNHNLLQDWRGPTRGLQSRLAAQCGTRGKTRCVSRLSWIRTIAHDRRGHGRSSQSWNANDMNGYADDLRIDRSAGLEGCDPRRPFSRRRRGSRYIGRHGTKRVAKAVLIGAVPPLMLKTEANQAGCRSRCSTESAQAF